MLTSACAFAVNLADGWTFSGPLLGASTSSSSTVLQLKSVDKVKIDTIFDEI
jgi:hypothetical protein